MPTSSQLDRPLATFLAANSATRLAGSYPKT
jgi:hypothetical protein